MSPRELVRTWSGTLLRGLIAAGLSALGATLVVTSAHAPLQQRRLEQRALVVTLLSPIRAKLEGAVSTNLALIEGIAAYVALHPAITQHEFASISQRLIGESCQVLNVGAAPGLVVRFMYPLRGNEAAVGLDYGKVPGQRQAARRAIETKQTTLAGPVGLVQGGQGLIGRVPIFSDDDPLTAWGLVSAVIDVSAVYEVAGLMESDLELDIVIRGRDGTGAGGEVFYGGLDRLDEEPITMAVAVANGEWELLATPKKGWHAFHRASHRPAILTVALAMAFFLIGLVYIYYRNQARLAYLALSRTDKRREEILWGTDTGTWEWAVPTGELVLNERWAEILGYSLKELAPISIKTWERLAHPDDRERSSELLERNFSHDLDYYECELRMLHEEGHWVWILDRGKVVQWTEEGQVLRMSGTHSDISARKEVEARVRRSEQLLSNLAAQVPGAIYQYLLRPDGSSCFPFASDGIEAIYGVRPEQIVESAELVFAVLHPDDLEEVSAGIAASAEGLQAWQSEYRVILAGQEPSWREGHAMPERLEDGSTLWHGSITNIDERKRVELALETSETRYRRLVERTQAEYLIYSHDKDGIFRYVSPSVELVLGYTPDEFLCHYSTYHTDSAINDIAEEMTERALRGEKPPAYDVELRHKNGEYRRLAISETPVFDADGAVVAVEGIAHDITAQRRAEEEITRMALTDPLTGLANRNQFNTRFKRALALAERQGKLTGLLMLDLDRFKSVNDRYGHSVGDALLKKVSALLEETSRGTDTVARLGGDEFAVIVVDPDGGPALGLLAERVIKVLCLPLTVGEYELQIGVSVGISCAPADGCTMDELMERADQALYAAKAAGRATYRFFGSDPSFRELL